MKRAVGYRGKGFGGVARLGLILLAASWTLTVASAADALTKVRLLLDVNPTSTHTPFFVAKDHGFYREAGLDVEITPGTGSASTAELVGLGRATFGYADAGAVLISEAAGVPIVMIAAFPRQTMLTIFGRVDRGIRKLSDLEDKSVGLAPATAEAKLFPALAKKNGLNLDDVKTVALAFPTRIPAIASGRVDAIGDFYTDFEDIASQLPDGARDLTALKFSDYGISLYGNGLVVDVDFARDHPAVVSAFTKATMRGLAYSLAHPDEALQSTFKAIPTGNRDLLRSHWVNAMSFMQDAGGRSPELGLMSEAEWKRTQDLMSKYGGLTKELDLDRVYTNRYLE
jgi:NitT/TauT family transport system substrate-binding protein